MSGSGFLLTQMLCANISRTNIFFSLSPPISRTLLKVKSVDDFLHTASMTAIAIMFAAFLLNLGLWISRGLPTANDSEAAHLTVEANR